MSDPTTQPRIVTPFNEGWLFVPNEVSAGTSWDEFSATAVGVGIPHTWNAGGEPGVQRRGRSGYGKRFTWAAEEGETWLEFRGVNASAEIHLNGVHLGAHDGGYSTFRVDLTPALEEGTNTLLVAVDNGANETVYPQMADFTFYGGIYRDVFLINVPQQHFRLDDHGGPGFVVNPEVDGAAARVWLRAETTGGDSVRFAVAGEGEIVAPIVDGRAEASIVIDDVHRWHGLSDPHLYTASAELVVAGEAVDRVDLRFGCREFDVDPHRGFLLNGQPYPLRGISRHQDFEGVGNAIGAEHRQTDLALILELGATSVRLAHYQHDQHFYDLCDEVGLVVWAEIPQITRFMPGGTPNATSQLTELIVQNRHHASIACWALSNEITIAGNSDEVLTVHQQLNDLAHSLDPTRRTSIAHAFLLDGDDPLVTVADVMAYNLYYGWYLGELGDNDDWLDGFHAAHEDVPVGLSEYGADANLAYQTSTPTRGDYSEQFQAMYHEHLLRMIEDRPWIWCSYVWNLADFGADGRDEGGTVGRNQKGLVSFDRTLKKDAFYLYKAAWSTEPFVHVCGRRYVDRPEPITEVTVYTNAPEVSLWRDDQLVATRSGRRIFRFDVPLDGEHTLVARAGDVTDEIRVRRVDEPNPDYRLTVSQVANWFETEELPAPEGRFSINDTLGEIRSNPTGAAIIDQLMKAAAASKGEVAKNVEIPAALRAFVDRLTLRKLIQQAGGAMSADQVASLNAALNQIAK